MDKLIEHTPAIIEQAAKSPLGIFALMIIALAVLGFFFFRESSERTRIGMFVLLFIGVAAFGIAAVRSTSAIAPAPTEAVTNANIAGRWQAQVSYDWGDLTRSESFEFKTDGSVVYGTASFLGGKRGILEGKLAGDKLTFITRTQEILSDETRDVTHRYRGTVSRDENEIYFVMQTEGGFAEHVPIEFAARRK